MKQSKQAIIFPPAPSKKQGSNRGQSSGSDKTNKNYSKSQKSNANSSYLSSSSKNSNDNKKERLNNSFEEKKKRLEKLTKLLKGEKSTLKEELDGSDEEEFQFIMKETAMKQFQKQVEKQSLVEEMEVQTLDELNNQATMKKDQLPGYLNSEQSNLQQTLSLKDRLGKENIQSVNGNTLQNGIVPKNPAPQRGGKLAFINNFVDDAEPTDQKQNPNALPKKQGQTQKKMYSQKQKVLLCILIQSIVRMFIQKRKYQREKQRLELLLKEHQMEIRQKREQDEQEQREIELGKGGPLSGRYVLNFTLNQSQNNKIEQTQNNKKAESNQRNSKKRTHSEGPFSLYQQMKQNEEEGIIDEEEIENRTFKLYQSKFNPLRKNRPPLPAKVPLNNNFFTDKGIVDAFIKKNKNNIPSKLKKSTSGDSFALSTLPEYQELLKKSKQAIKPQQNIQKWSSKQEEESIIYSDTFEKESIEISPHIKKLPFSKTTTTPQNKRASIHSGISEEEYLRESFDLETPKESIKESIRESFAKESNRFQSSFSLSAKIKEDIPEESMIGESINESSIIDETEPKTRKKKASSIQEDIIQTSIEEDDYYNENFESISEDLNDNSGGKGGRDSISEDIAGMSFESKSRRSKKKSVTFGQKQQAQQQKNPGSSIQQTTTLPNQQSLQNNNSGILRRSTESLSVDQMLILNQKSKESIANATFQKMQTNNPQATIQAVQDMYFGKDGLSDAWKKFEDLKQQYGSDIHKKELQKEQIEIGQMQQEIYQMIQNTKNLTQRWQEESSNFINTDKAAYKADQLYSKFQSEFNRVLQNTPMVNRFSLLKNYLEFRDRQMANQNLFKPIVQQKSDVQDIKKEVALQVENMVKNMEQKQEIIKKVLEQVVDNLANLKQTSLDFEDMKRIRDLNNSKLDQLLANQEKTIKFQFEQEMQFREDQLKLLYSGQPISEEELKRIRIRYLLAQNRKEDILPQLQPQKFNNIPLNRQKQTTADYISDFESPYHMKTEESDRDVNRFKEVSLSSSIDFEAMSDSKISWQSGQDMWDNLSERDRERVNNFNTEQVVDFLTQMLMDEIQTDLFPMRMTTSHLYQKKNEKLIQEKAIEKIGYTKPQTQYGEKKGVSSQIQDSPSNRGNYSYKQKSDKTLTEESKYESDFEDSEDKFGQSLQSNRSNNKSYQFEDNEISGGKQKSQSKDQDRNQKQNNETLEQLNEEESEEFEYEQDFEESVEKQPTPQSKGGSTPKQDKSSKITAKEDFIDPMGGSKAFDRNSLLAEIEDNDQKNPPLPKLSIQQKPSSANKQKQFDDDDYKGDNDFFEPKVENENGQIEKNPNKDLYKNQQYYDKTSRTLNQLKIILKKKDKKKMIVQKFIQIISSNNIKGKKFDKFLGTILPSQVQIFEKFDYKSDEDQIVGMALQEHFFSNMIKNIQDLEQFHYDQAFNKKEIVPEIIMRWDHICDVAAQQTLQILEKVVPVGYYSDVKIDKYTPFKKVKRFCAINTVAKEDNDLFELQNYELYKEQILVQNDLSDDVLQKIVNQLARDLITIQNKQSSHKN